MFDLKVIHSVLQQLEEERGIPREKVLEAIEAALATAYKKEYGKKSQIIRVRFDVESGKTDFFQVKIVVDPDKIRMPDSASTEDDEEDIDEPAEGEEKIRFNPEQHILLPDAKKIKKGVEVGEEIVFPLEEKGDFGRISAQTAKQVIIQKIREAERVSVSNEYGQRQGEIVAGVVQRVERGSIFVDLGRATGVISFEEQIPGERYRAGERIRAYLYRVEDSPRGIFLRLSRSSPDFLKKLFGEESPEIASGVVEIKSVAREAGSRSKIAVFSNDDHIDPIGACVGQRGVRVSTIMSELGGEKIDIIEWAEDPEIFIEDALSPAKVLGVEIDEAEKKATVEVSDDQQSLAIGKGGQNVRLAAKLTGWRIDIKSAGRQPESEDSDEGEHNTHSKNKKETAADAEIEKENEETEKVVDEKIEGAEVENSPLDSQELTASKLEVKNKKDSSGDMEEIEGESEV